MSSILEQINQLSNQFSSLFEIEGLGEPSGDVPPSTNKIKKDVKTKNGKVELVSVEDELFPKDGNKREQFRQKVIDTINGMIQGTATLEDLLQVVRQKQVKAVKEGFESAIELLEELIKESSHKRKYGNSNAEDGDTVGHLGTKYFKDGSAMHPHRVTKSNGHNGVDYAPLGTEYYDFDDKKVLQNTIKKLKKEGKEGLEGEEFKKVQKELTNPDTKNNMYGAPVRWASWKLANRKGKSDLPHKGIGVYTYRKGKNDGSKTKDDKDVKERASETKKRLMDKSESVELSNLLENIYTQIEKVHGEAKYNPMNYSAKLMDKANKIFHKEADEAERREGRNVRTKRINSNARKREWTRYHGGEWSTNPAQYDGAYDEEASNKKKEKRSKKKDESSESYGGFESAIELLEDLYDQIRKVHGEGEYYKEVEPWSVGYKPANKSAKLINKVKEIQKKEEEEAAKRESGKDINNDTWTYSTEVGKIRSKRNQTKNDKGERKTYNRRPYKDIESPLYKKPVKEGFESAIKLLEDLINEVSDATIEGAVTCANNNVINADRNNNQKDIDRYKKIKKLASLRAEKTGRKLKANVDTGEYKHVNKNESIEEMVDEALEKSAKILELFDRPDLLNDVDSLLGSPVKKLINKTISSLKWKRKDKKVKTNKA